MFKSLIKASAQRLGYNITRIPSPAVIDGRNRNIDQERFDWLLHIRDASKSAALVDFVTFCARHFTSSESQLFQDLFVLHVLSSKRNGYFVEFGATDGIGLSNTYLLEKSYGWKGILAEPARGWHEKLASNRTSSISFDCVWTRSGELLDFQETDWREVSTIAAFAGVDSHAETRKSGHSYSVRTISLNDLLEKFAAPSEIDYLSIDTEGSEFEILSAFDFDRWRFRVLTVEHNYTSAREKLWSLLESKGYRRVMSELSKFDDWYVHSSLL